RPLAGRPPRRRGLRDAAPPAGGSCANGGSCWTGRGSPAGSKGFLYKDSKILLPDGLKRVKIQPGTAGKAKTSVSGRGIHLPLPSPMKVTQPALVQLPGANGTRFSSAFTAAERNLEDALKAVDTPDAAFPQ